MTLPRIFADVPTGALVPGGDLDDDLDQVGSMGVMPCAASGTNTIALVPFPGLPDLTGYADYLRFSFVATATSTGPVTVNVAGLGAKKWFAADGVTQLDAGQVAINEFYDIVFIQRLDSNAGGFISAAASSAPSGPVGPHSIQLSNIVQIPAHTILGNPNAISDDVEAMDRTTYLTEILGTPTPSLTGGTLISVTGTWPNQTVSYTGVTSSGGGAQLAAQAFVDSDGTLLSGVNIAGSSSAGTGLYDISLTTALTDANYSAVATPENDDYGCNVPRAQRTVNSLRVRTWHARSTGPEAADSAFSLIIAGTLVTPPYHASAVHFNNASGDPPANYLFLASALSGVADGSVGVFSVWLKDSGPTGGGGFGTIWADFIAGGQPDDYATVAPGSFGCGNGWADSTGGNDFQTTGPNTATGVWYNLIVSWDVNHNSGSRVIQLYLNDVAGLTSISDDTGAAFQSPWSTIGSFLVGAHPTDNPFTIPDAGYNGDMADFQFYPNVTLDLSVPANRRNFISASGKPVNPATAIGALGVPAILFSGNASTFPINQGSAGTFTLAGSLTNASTSPSD